MEDVSLSVNDGLSRNPDCTPPDMGLSQSTGYNFFDNHGSSYQPQFQLDAAFQPFELEHTGRTSNSHIPVTSTHFVPQHDQYGPKVLKHHSSPYISYYSELSPISPGSSHVQGSNFNTCSLAFTRPTFLTPTSYPLPTHSSPSEAQPNSIPLYKSRDPAPQTSNSAASLLAILNGPAADTTQAYTNAPFALSIPTPPSDGPRPRIERISSADDPPIVRPCPIGARTPPRQVSWTYLARQESVQETHAAPPWPPRLSG
jgi:hypothetical protein